MTIEEFRKASSLQEEVCIELTALWLDYQGEWAKAHDLIDQLPGTSAARVHAYLHRKEGDQWNADYWYRRAGESRPNLTLDEEWEELVERYLTLDRPN